LEYAEVFDNLYGTSKSQVQKELDAGQHVLLEIDWQGAQQIRQAWPDCVSVFILPPSLPELERRLRTRATDSEKVIQRRLRDAISDIGHWPEFDHVILNDNLKQALQDLKHVVAGISEQTRTDNPDQIDLIHRCGFSTAARLADSEEE
ncbi:MAG: guanylate kinase, partial [Gammaproteobacteria bacterium]|nr:guanylate kinase [Gammaproteobacteria bacterium]